MKRFTKRIIIQKVKPKPQNIQQPICCGNGCKNCVLKSEDFEKYFLNNVKEK